MTEERQSLIDAVGRATQAYQRATDGFDDEVGRTLDLNPTDLRCLDWLTGGAMSAGELAEATGLSSAATTSLLDRLEAKGFVQRQGDPGDRRKVLVALTDDGMSRVGALYGPLAEEGGRLLDRFDDSDLAMVRDFLLDATGVVERHRERLRADRAERDS